MSQVYTIDQKLANFVMPELEEVSHIPFEANDTLIVCSGFEDRAFEVLNRLKVSSKSFGRIIIIEYLPFVKENKEIKFEEFCIASKISYQKIKYDREYPEDFGVKFIEGFNVEGGRIYIDISGMSKILIVLMIVILGHHFEGFKGIIILYAEAERYSPTKDEVEEISSQSAEAVGFISSGVFGIHVIPELSSVAMQGHPVRLIVFPSFGLRQLAALWGEFQPSYLSIMNGIPHLDKDSWRKKAINELNCIPSFPNKDEFDVSTLYYHETLGKLLEIYKKRNFLDKILIAPTGSKMQAVAVGLFRAYLNDIQVVYPTPKSFTEPEKYTEGVQKIYSLNLNTFPEITF